MHHMIAVILSASFAAAAHAEPPPAPTGVGAWVAAYGAEYLGVASAAALVVGGSLNVVDPVPAMMGPRFELDAPDAGLLLDSRLDDVVGRPMLQEKVPAWTLGAVLASGIALDAGFDLVLRRDLQRAHALILGGAEAVMGAAAVTEVLKLGVGRLRPDFRERWLRAACGGVVERPASVSCDGVLDDGFAVDRAALLDGMKSFPSGHASAAFAGATFVALHLAHEGVWGSQAPEWAAPVAALAVGGLMTGAGFVAASRVADHRHYIEDVVVGAGIGVASGCAAWLAHFRLDGTLRRRGVAVAPVPIAGGGGLSVRGAL